MDYRVAKMTDVIRETAAGVYLDSRESFYQDARENKTVGKPLPTIVWIKRLPGFAKEGSLAALEVCVDATKTVVTRNGKQLPEGEMFFGRFYFNRIDGRLKIANADIGKGPKC